MPPPIIVIDATIGGTDTNSYLSLARAEELIHARPFHSDWDAITDEDEKNAALVWATRILSHRDWVGVLAAQTQKQAWPRTGTYDLDGREYASDAYPEWLEVSCAELALIMIISDRLGDSGTEGFSKIKIDTLEFEIDPNDRVEVIPDYILDAISMWLSNSSLGTFVRV